MFKRLLLSLPAILKMKYERKQNQTLDEAMMSTMETLIPETTQIDVNDVEDYEEATSKLQEHGLDAIYIEEAKDTIRWIEKKEYQFNYKEEDLDKFGCKRVGDQKDPNCWVYAVTGLTWNALQRAEEQDENFKRPKMFNKIKTEEDLLNHIVESTTEGDSGASSYVQMKAWSSIWKLHTVVLTQEEAIKIISERKMPICFGLTMNNINMTKFQNFFNREHGSDAILDNKKFEELQEPETLESKTGHATIINGFNPFKGYFKALSSWGKDWGDNGHFRLGLDCLPESNKEKPIATCTFTACLTQKEYEEIKDSLSYKMLNL